MKAFLFGWSMLSTSASGTGKGADCWVFATKQIRERSWRYTWPRRPHPDPKGHGSRKLMLGAQLGNIPSDFKRSGITATWVCFRYRRQARGSVLESHRAGRGDDHESSIAFAKDVCASRWHAVVCFVLASWPLNKILKWHPSFFLSHFFVLPFLLGKKKEKNSEDLNLFCLVLTYPRRTEIVKNYTLIFLLFAVRRRMRTGWRPFDSSFPSSVGWGRCGRKKKTLNHRNLNSLDRKTNEITSGGIRAGRMKEADRRMCISRPAPQGLVRKRPPSPAIIPHHISLPPPPLLTSAVQRSSSHSVAASCRPDADGARLLEGGE